MAASQWPTPTVQDAEKDGGPGQYERHSIPLNAAVKDSPQVGGQLNPAWVEPLMGFPQGWTDLAPLREPVFPNQGTWHDGSWEEGIERVASGTPHRASRLSALGDSVVWQQAVLAWSLF